MMRELTENIVGQQELVDALDWYIVPCVNPDGYAYTWSDDRLWRKTRRAIYNLIRELRNGVDIVSRSLEYNTRFLLLTNI